jgi:hypothetical protein
MASKKKRLPRSRATNGAKPRSSTGQGGRKAARASGKAGARKTAARSGATGAKRKPARKPAVVTAAKARPIARAKPKSQKAAAPSGLRSAEKRKKPAQVAVTKKGPRRLAEPAPATKGAGFGPPVLDEAIAEPLHDASLVLRIKDRFVQSQRDSDEDEQQRFADPSLVVDAQVKNLREHDEPSVESGSQVPNLFEEEARRQEVIRLHQARTAGVAQKGTNGALFASLEPSALKGNARSLVDGDPDSGEPDED